MLSPILICNNWQVFLIWRRRPRFFSPSITKIYRLPISKAHEARRRRMAANSSTANRQSSSIVKSRKFSGVAPLQLLVIFFRFFGIFFIYFVCSVGSPGWTVKRGYSSCIYKPIYMFFRFVQRSSVSRDRRWFQPNFQSVLTRWSLSIIRHYLRGLDESYDFPALQLSVYSYYFFLTT